MRGPQPLIARRRIRARRQHRMLAGRTPVVPHVPLMRPHQARIMPNRREIRAVARAGALPVAHVVPEVADGEIISAGTSA